MPVEIRELCIKVNVEEEPDYSQLFDDLVESARKGSDNKVEAAATGKLIQAPVHEN